MKQTQRSSWESGENTGPFISCSTAIDCQCAKAYLQLVNLCAQHGDSPSYWLTRLGNKASRKNPVREVFSVGFGDPGWICENNIHRLCQFVNSENILLNFFFPPVHYLLILSMLIKQIFKKSFLISGWMLTNIWLIGSLQCHCCIHTSL